MINKLQEYLNSKGLEAFKALCYNYTARYNHACILDSCELEPNGNYELLAAYGSSQVYHTYTDFVEAYSKQSDWYFGLISYDVKNHFEKLESNNAMFADLPETALFIPQIVVSISKDGQVNLEKGTVTLDFWEPKSESILTKISTETNTVDKSTYLNKINEIHSLIREGNVYELNYCLNTVRDFDEFDTIDFQKALVDASPVPMANYLKSNQHVLCGASMERFIKKEGKKIISQPIKGTAKRGITKEEDVAMANQLLNSIKEKAENVMIVDLVRNDFGRVCKPGSIKVEELFGIHTFPQVHQMISTVVGELENGIELDDIFNASFPMGSMTGAPKIAAMQLIEELEDFKRNWYSGTCGYVCPEGNFDFNVVIRSVIVDLVAKKLSYSAGGAITIDSVANDEWNEVQLKKQGIETALNNLAL